MLALNADSSCHQSAAPRQSRTKRVDHTLPIGLTQIRAAGKAQSTAKDFIRHLTAARSASREHWLLVHWFPYGPGFNFVSCQPRAELCVAGTRRAHRVGHTFDPLVRPLERAKFAPGEHGKILDGACHLHGRSIRSELMHELAYCLGMEQGKRDFGYTLMLPTIEPHAVGGRVELTF